MNAARAAQLLDINRRFYLEHGRDFAETRERVQPGVRRVLESLRAEDAILDLGCGNGAFARALSLSGHRGPYLGLDFSPALLERARLGRYDFPVTFLEADLSSPQEISTVTNAGFEKARGGPRQGVTDCWQVVTAFAVLHHLPGHRLRLAILEQARQCLLPSGRLILSNWQFSDNIRMRSRIVSWNAAGLSAEDVDDGDRLVDWRRGGAGVRYVHEFSEAELSALATESGFTIWESFRSDGADRRSGLYQIWKPA